MPKQLTAILGAGAWGTTLAVILARNGTPVVLCVRRADHLAVIRADRENRAYLPGVAIPARVELTDDWAEAASRAQTVVMAVPSRFARHAMAQAAGAIRHDAVAVSATKGIEEGTLRTMSAMLAELAPKARAFAALSGPGFAAEVARGKPAALVAASRDEQAAMELQHMFASPSLRIYRSADIIGVELSGAAKNVIAIAAGISDGLDLGSSARAALITRGLAELARLVEAAGARGETAMGLAGLGDLVLTCTGDMSRNRSFGLRVGREGLAPALKASGTGGPVIEGIANARSIKGLAARHGAEMPIVSAVYRTLYEGAQPKAMVEELLSRALKAEF